MLIVALVLAVIGLAALVTAVVTSNELIAWVCIAASVVGVLLLIVDAVRERSNQTDEVDHAEGDDEPGDEPGDEPSDDVTSTIEPVDAEDYPDEPVTEEAESVAVPDDAPGEANKND